MRGSILLQRASIRHRTRIAAAVLLLIPAFGCAAKHGRAWTPKPLVQWVHVSTHPVQPVRDGYRIMIAQPTHGLFPASLGVTRLAIDMLDERTQMTRPYLLADPRNEFLQWNRAFDDQMAISEVFPVAERDLGGGEADPLQVLAAFRALHARLGLVYAVNELSSTEAEMFGVLYDTTSAQAVASVHTRAVSVSPSEAKEAREAVDPWDTDARALVRQKFERLVHACIRELILNDAPEVIESPEGWTPAGPILPVEWPPRRFRTRSP